MSSKKPKPKPKPKTPADREQILLAVLIGLALVGSVIMLLVDSEGAQKIALLAALWAALIGFFLLYRDRKQVEAARQELAASEAVHKAELDKKQAEQQAEKFRLEKLHQTELRLKDNETLKEIRQQLEEMRAQLSELSGREWVYEPAVVQAEARRIIELESEQNRQERAAVETAAVPEPVALEHVEPVSTPEWSEKVDEPQDVVDVQVEQPAVEPAPEDTEPGEEEPRSSRHSAPDAGGGRRRRDERSGGVSVADLLAAAKKKEQN